MPAKITNPTDPDSQALIEVLANLQVLVESAYNATQGVRNMAGANVIAKIEAMEVSTNARLEAMEARTNARFDMLEVRLDALSAQIDFLAWTVMATLVLVTALTAKEFLGGRKKRRSRRGKCRSRSNR